MGLLIDSKGTVHHNALSTVQVDCPTTVAALTAGAGEVGTTELATNAVTTVKITDGAVTAAKIASDAVTTVKILDANVTAGKLASDAVTTVKILDANVTAGKLASDAVTTVKILDANVTTGKLAAGAVTLPKMDLFTGLKILAADGANSGGGDTQVTLTGTVIGNRVVAIFGHVKANTGAHTFLVPTIPTHFEGTITVTDKIIQKQAAGDLSSNTYIFIIAPAAA